MRGCGGERKLFPKKFPFSPTYSLSIHNNHAVVLDGDGHAVLDVIKELFAKAVNDGLGVEVLDHYNETNQSSGHLYITRVPNITAEQRNDIIIKMAEQGIATNVHYKPLPMHTAYKNLGFDIADYPNAYAHFANEITLPLHTNLTDEQVEYVIENYTKILKEYI